MNFWKRLESQKITDRQTIKQTLIKKLGQPATELQTNLLTEIIKKIISYYLTEPDEQNYTTHSLIGTVLEVSEKKHKEGPKTGQVFYVLKLVGKEKLQAKKELLEEDQWTQIAKLEILGQNLVFKYRKWFSNKQVLGFGPANK
jgi:hypothetical protein